MIDDEDEDEYHILDVLSYKKIKLLTQMKMILILLIKLRFDE